MTTHRVIFKWHRLCALIIACSAFGAVQAGELKKDFGRALVHDYIAPATQRFNAAALKLHNTLDAFCAAADAQDTAQVNKDFATLIKAWSGIEFLRFGPLVAANRFERIYFWPDARGIMLRQVQALLATPEKLPDAAGLSKHSVAVQGLPALEYVLYREKGLLAKNAAVDPAACRYASAVAGNIAQVGGELNSQWALDGEYATQFSQPSSGNPLYRTQHEVAGEAIKALSTGLQFARDVKLLPVLGTSLEAAQPRRAAFWRSGLSTHAMAASAEGLRLFYLAGAYQYADNEKWIGTSVNDELTRLRDNFQSMQGSMQSLTQSADGYRQLSLAALMLKNAKSIVDEDVAPAFGLQIGFNALDGD